MRSHRFIPLVALALIISLTGPYAVKAGPPPSPSVTGAAMLKGTVRLQGAVAKPKPISMAADPSCAKLHPSPALNEEVVTDAKGDLENVVVFISEGLGDRKFEPPTQPAVMEQKGCVYQPHVLAMRAD